MARAFARTKPDHPISPPRVFSPVDPRRRLLDSAENLAFYVNGVIVDLPKFDEKFWEDARVYSAKARLFKDRDLLAHQHTRRSGRRGGMHLQWKWPRAIWVQVFGAEVLLSNLGNIDIPLVYGGLHLTGLWAPAISVGIADEESIGAATLDGRLHLLNLSFKAPIGFLDTGGRNPERGLRPEVSDSRAAYPPPDRADHAPYLLP